MNKLPDDFYDSLFASGSASVILYDLHKMHKTGCLIRSILLAIRVCCSLAKFFVMIDHQ